MDIQVKEKAQKTQEYLRYIFGEMTKRQPLRTGELVEIKVIKDSTPFPEFTEIPTEPVGKAQPILDVSGKIIGKAYKFPYYDKPISTQIFDKENVRRSKIEALHWYTEIKLAGMCRFRYSNINDGGPISTTFYFTVADPEKIRLKAEEYGPVIQDTGNKNNMGSQALKKDLKIILNLEGNGDLWRDPKSKYCYRLMESKERLSIVKFFAGNQTAQYIETKEVALASRKDKEYVRREIGRINRIVQNKLKTKKIKLIEGRQGSGYRLNPGIKIKVLSRYS